MTFYQNCSNHSAPLNKQATRAKNRINYKQPHLLNQWMHFEIIIQKCFLGDPLSTFSNRSLGMNKMAARAINRKKALKNFLDRF